MATLRLWTWRHQVQMLMNPRPRLSRPKGYAVTAIPLWRSWRNSARSQMCRAIFVQGTWITWSESKLLSRFTGTTTLVSDSQWLSILALVNSGAGSVKIEKMLICFQTQPNQLPSDEETAPVDGRYRYRAQQDLSLENILQVTRYVEVFLFRFGKRRREFLYPNGISTSEHVTASPAFFLKPDIIGHLCDHHGLKEARD